MKEKTPKKEKKPSRFRSLENKYKEDQQAAREKIRLEPNAWKRFWKWVWYLITFPFKWLWLNIRDWRTALIFIIVALIVSCEVWVPYLIGLITWGTPLSKIMLGVGSTCWLFWLGPGTPFLIICIGTTIGVKELFNKIEDKKYGKRNKDEKQN